MGKKRLSQKLKTGDSFVIVAEVSAGPNYNFAPINKFLKGYKDADASSIPDEFDFTGIACPQSPGGVANIEPASVQQKCLQEKLLGDLDMIPHLSCKDLNSDALLSALAGYKINSTDSILALTGDKPVKGKGVFELDSIGLLSLMKYLNNESYTKSKPENLDSVFQFFPGAAVSPFKYTESSQMQQYYKMEKKIKCGARFLITQVGWDWKKSQELFQYLNEQKIDIPVLGNVYFLSSTTAAPRLMHDIKLPGCFVSDQLLEKLYSESVDDHIERAAQQVAMYKQLGAAGVDIAGVHDYAIFEKILHRASEIGADWQQFKENLCFPAEKTFYLYDENGNRNPLKKYKRKCHARFFDFMHWSILDPAHCGFHAFKAIMSGLGTRKGKGFFYKGFNSSEKAIKYLLFDCKECGDCYLPENFGYCTIGGCEKGLDNVPCGDSTVDGKCGNNLERVCIGESVYEAAAAKKNGKERLKNIINKPRIPQLEHSSSILNYLFGKDHTMKNPLISIGETVHASIPKNGKVMKALAEFGPDAYTKVSPQLNFVRSLIESQVAENADYIAVNVDAFGEDDPQVTIDTMKEYIRMVRKWGSGVPICIDSSDDNVLIEGLKEWYNTDKPVKAPMLNSIKVYSMDKILPLKKHMDFVFIGLLIGEDKPTGPGGSHSIEELFSFAQRIFDTAVDKYNFKPQEIFFDSTVFPLAIDMPMQPNVPGYTYRAFETIKKIKNDPKMKNVHFSLGVSNSVRDLPARRIGVIRAYIAKAMEYGLDTAILNTKHRFGYVEPAPELLKLVDAFVKMDGSAERLNDSMKLMGEFCRKNKKSS